MEAYLVPSFLFYSKVELGDGFPKVLQVILQLALAHIGDVLYLQFLLLLMFSRRVLLLSNVICNNYDKVIMMMIIPPPVSLLDS